MKVSTPNRSQTYANASALRVSINGPFPYDKFTQYIRDSSQNKSDLAAIVQHRLDWAIPLAQILSLHGKPELARFALSEATFPLFQKSKEDITCVPQLVDTVVTHILFAVTGKIYDLDDPNFPDQILDERELFSHAESTIHIVSEYIALANYLPMYFEAAPDKKLRTIAALTAFEAHQKQSWPELSLRCDIWGSLALGENPHCMRTIEIQERIKKIHAKNQEAPMTEEQPQISWFRKYVQPLVPQGMLLTKPSPSKYLKLD